MLRVVSVSDKVDTAIDRLCHGVEKYHDNIDYQVVAIHPKREEPENLKAFSELAKDADIMDYQYFRTADMLREMYPWLKDKPSILTHNNPYSIHERDWSDYQIVVANNLTMQTDLSTITPAKLEYIPLTIDLDFWTFNDDWQPKDQVIMVANRIEGKKGILEVAIAAADAGLKFVLVGAISDANYFNDIMATGNVEFHEQISDDELKKLYYESLLHVCNSTDNFESGTLPILESMACGVPVLSREVGHVPDLSNGENMIINQASSEDVEAITKLLSELDHDKLKQMRENAWKTVKSRNHERRAYSYQRLYRSLVSTEKPVSIITPIYDKPEITKQTLQAIADQTYSNIELIICNDNPDGAENKKLVAEFAATVKFPVRYIDQPSDGYGLAKQRNLAAIEATGDILVFCDQRIKMDKNAVKIFVQNSQARYWLYGTKGVKKEFVENFSSIMRDDFIKMGMFNERMDCYGGLSQETRSRAKYQGYQITYLPDAMAVAQGKSSNKYSKRAEIIKSKNRLWKIGMEL
jgi:glycosyltransferase involved in cell wall biosynthesis